VRVVRNPILRGSHPDPSVLRVGDDYFIATSTFEWAPGVRLHHSRDLVDWQLIGHALMRPSQLDLRGVPDSGGVWAPSLTHDGKRFYLASSLIDMRRAWPLVGVANEEDGRTWRRPFHVRLRGLSTEVRDLPTFASG